MITAENLPRHIARESILVFDEEPAYRRFLAGNTTTLADVDSEEYEDTEVPEGICLTTYWDYIVPEVPEVD